MKGRNILSGLILLVAVALMGCSQLPTQLVPAAPAGQSVQGEEVARSGVRLFSDPQKTNLAFEIQNGRVYQGSVSQGQTILFFNGQRVYRGANTTGEILFTVSGNRIFVGANTTGPIAYTVQNGRVFEGTDKGPIIYTIRGDRLFQGPNTTGAIVFEANANLTGTIQFLLPILADRRF
ncbi:MAG: hypothetical protein ACE5HA_07365 [Anaerolineae bacterium]